MDIVDFIVGGPAASAIDTHCEGSSHDGPRVRFFDDSTERFEVNLTQRPGRDDRIAEVLVKFLLVADLLSAIDHA